MPIGMELVKKGVITETDINKALEYQREKPNIKLGDILHIQNAADAEKLIQAIGDIIGEKGIVLTSNSLNAFSLSFTENFLYSILPFNAFSTSYKFKVINPE